MSKSPGSGTGNRHYIKKTALTYAGVSALCILITNVYAIFGHGVRSYYMDFMFLCPLAGGALFLIFYTAVYRRKLTGWCRLGFNFYNSGIATLTCGFLLTGIMEIAGTGSALIKYFYIAGAICSIVGAAVLLLHSRKV
jgi:hypothetical protein